MTTQYQDTLFRRKITNALVTCTPLAIALLTISVMPSVSLRIRIWCGAISGGLTAAIAWVSKNWQSAGDLKAEPLVPKDSTP